MGAKILAVLGIVGALGACLIAQPPGDPPPIDLKRPVIQSYNAIPALASTITVIDISTKLVVQVECDPEASLEYRLFLDFDPVNNPAAISQGTLPKDDTHSPTREVAVGLFGGFNTGQCHTLTLIVAACLGNSCSGFSTQSPWTPLMPPGGDQENWFYRPNGNEGQCPGYDAGTFADAAAFETGAE